MAFSDRGGLHREATRECGSSRRVGRGICFADFPTPTVLWPERVATGTARQAHLVPVRRHPGAVAAPRSPDYPAAPSACPGVGFIPVPKTVLAGVLPAPTFRHLQLQPKHPSNSSNSEIDNHQIEKHRSTGQQKQVATAFSNDCSHHSNSMRKE